MPKIKCLALTRKPANSKRLEVEISRCTHFALEGSRFCLNHQNLHLLTEEQFTNNTKMCSGCKKHKFFPDMSKNTCDDDRERKNNMSKDKPPLAPLHKPCLKCKRTNGSEREYPDYCNKHKTLGRRADIENRGFKCCNGITRGCPNPELPKDYKFKACAFCLNKERAQDNARSESKLVETQNSLLETVRIKANMDTKTEPLDTKDDVAINTIIEPVKDKADFDEIHIKDGYPYKVCSSPKHHCSHKIDDFLSKEGKCVYEEWKLRPIDKKKISIEEICKFLLERHMVRRVCQTIRDINKKADDKRVGRDRKEEQKAYESKQSTKDMRKKWKEENIEKVRDSYKNYRYRMSHEDPPGFREHLAKIARIWRENNKQYMRDQYEKGKKDPYKKFYTYRKCAKRDEKLFELTYEQCERLFKGDCVYCGKTIIDGYLNGIDRTDNGIGYVYNNCVSCCKMCNYMKGVLHPLVFIYMCENILINLHMIEGEQHEKIMVDTQSGSYKDYVAGAKNRGISFNITTEQFDQICSQNCYLCGKQSGNGIDRFDNQLGYLYENCRPCCTMCNYFKRDYTYDEFIEQLHKIHNTKSAAETDVLPDKINYLSCNDMTNSAKDKCLHEKCRHKALVRGYCNEHIGDLPKIKIKLKSKITTVSQ